MDRKHDDRGETRSIAQDTPDAAPHRGLCLLVSTGSGVQVVALSRGTVVLGRAPEADIVVADDSVSRRHARLVVENRRITVADLESRNGTRVDGVRASPGLAMELHVGSSFELGSATIVLQRSKGFIDEETRLPAPRPTMPPGPSNGPVVADTAMKRLYALVDVIGPSPLAVLLLGETGVGKEVFARTIHDRSKRAAGAFLALNCAALPESLLEAELFGYEKGAFTGAHQAKAGLFESADGGTIFLDEVGEIPLGTQAKLLRFLETGEVMRLGSLKAKRVDVRFVSATNRDLRALIVEGRFRSDLFFRLNGMSIRVPPLRKRPADIVPLAEHFLERTAARIDRRPPRLTAAAARRLEGHPWPGNVRELRNVIERGVVMCSTGTLEPEDFHLDEDDPPSSAAAGRRPPSAALRIGTGDAFGPSVRRNMKMEDLSREAVLDALNRAAGNQSTAAKMLGISRRALIYRIEAYGIARPRKR